MAREAALYETAEAESIHVPVGERTVAQRDEMASWLSDPSRPGIFSYKPFRLRHGVVTFHITDPDVAMEFKMRWV